MDLGDDLAEDVVCRQVIKFSKRRVYALRVLQAHLRVLVSLENALWLSIEDNLLELGWVDLVLASGGTGDNGLVGKAELKKTLTARDLTTLITVLLELNNEPLDQGYEGLVVETRDLMREDCVGTLHLLK